MTEKSRVLSVFVSGAVGEVDAFIVQPASPRTVIIYENATKNMLYRDMIAVARRAIISLLRQRDFLGFQLAHANGSISDDQLDAIAEEYLASGECDHEELVHGAAILAGLVPDRFDAELVSAVFRCELDRASQAISDATARLADDRSEVLSLTR